MRFSDEMKALRLTGIGGSEIGAIAGVNPWCKPIDVWRAKVEGREIEETLPMKRGRILEPAIIDWYREETGEKVESNTAVFKHPQSKIVFSTPDGLIREKSKVLEVKSANRFTAEHWGEAGTDEIPESYLCQVAFEMACTDLSFADVAVLISGDDFRIYTVQRDRDLEERLVEQAERFWADYVVTRTPPPIDSSESFAHYLKDKFPSNRDELLPATPEAEKLARELAEIKAKVKALEADEELRKNLLKTLIGDASGLQGNGFKALWKNTKGRLATDWEAIARELHPPDDIVQKYTRIGQPSRRFTLNFKGDK